MATAASNVDQQQAAILAAIAQSGSAGRQALEQRNQQVASAQQAAQQAATQRANQVKVGGDFYKQQAAQISEPYQTASADTNAALAAYNQQIGGLEGLNRDYIGQVHAALPLVQSITQGQVAGIKAERADREAQRAFQREMQQLQLQEARERRGAADDPLKALRLQAEQGELEDAIAQRGQSSELQTQQKSVLDSISSSGLSVDAKDTFKSTVSRAEDFGTAMEQINAAVIAIQNKKDTKQSEKDKEIADIQSTIPFLRSYYFPGQDPLQLAAASAAAAAQAPAPAAKGGGIKVPNPLGGIQKKVRSSISNALKNPFGF